MKSWLAFVIVGALWLATAHAATKEPNLALADEQYRSEIRAGQKLASQARWGEAMKAFETALKARPGNARASLELGFAAFKAGDFPTARAASGRAIKNALDDTLKAQALYNLGLVAEAEGKREEAIEVHRQSLALRENRIVAERLAHLGAKGNTPSTAIVENKPPCATPRAENKVCSCLIAESPPSPLGGLRECSIERLKNGPEELRIVQLQLNEMEIAYFLLGQGKFGWKVIRDMGVLYQGGVGGTSGSWQWEAYKESLVGAKRVGRFTVIEDRTDDDPGLDECESETITREYVCVFDSAEQGPRCPIAVPTRTVYTRDRLGLVSEESLDRDARRRQTKGLPLRRESNIALEITAGGIARVVLVKGALAPEERLILGPHELW